MKKILSLIMVFFLLCANTIFATEGEVAEKTVPLSNETSVGLYYYDSWNKNYSSELYLSLGSRTKADFYFYDGNDYNEVKVGNLIPSEKIKLSLKEDHSQENNPLKIFVTSSKTGDGTISYSKDEVTYNVNVHTSLPGFGLYADTTASDSTYVWGLYNYEDTKVFHISSSFLSNDVFDVVSVGYYSGSDFVEVPYDYNSDSQTISWKHRTATSYDIKIQYVQDGETRDSGISVNNQRDLAGIVYGDDYITFGIAMTNDQNNLHITNGYGDYTKDYPKSVTYVLAAGKLYGPSAIVADETIYNSISNVSYSVSAVGMSEGEYSVEVSNTKISAFEREVYPVTVSFAANAKGRLDVVISFDLKMPNGSTERVETFQYFTLKEEKKIEVNLNSNDNISNILSSYDNLKNRFSDIDFEDANSIKVFLPDGGSFDGTLNIDMGKYNSYNGKIFELICTGENGYTINGGVDIKGGYVTLSGIKFNGTDVDDDVAVKATAPEDGHSVGYVYNCEFNDYDYAIKSIDKGTIFGVNSSVFRNCEYGYYIDCHKLDTSMSGGANKYNRFINCKNAIVMMSTPSNAPMFSWRFIDNEFYNDGSDYYDFVVGESNGVLYCQENYYGISENNVTSGSNLRSARVNYGATTGTEVVTNPCVRYYTSDYRLGIDPADGLYTRIFSGRASKINSADINNLREIGITGNDGQQLIGKLNFGE